LGPSNLTVVTCEAEYTRPPEHLISPWVICVTHLFVVFVSFLFTMGL
jgi:hypothetical protein